MAYAPIEDVLFAPEGALRGVIARFALFIKRAYVAAGAKGALAGAGDDDERDIRIALKCVERGGNLAHHRQVQRVERARPIEGDEPGAPAPLADRLGCRRRVSGAHAQALSPSMTLSRFFATSAITAMPSTSNSRPFAR